MITNPDWLKPKEKPYFHQISLDCIEKLVECIGRFNKGEIDADTSSIIERQILEDEFNDEEFTANGLKLALQLPFPVSIPGTSSLLHPDRKLVTKRL